MSKFLAIRDKIRASVPENVRQKLLAMKEDDDQSTTAIGEPVHAINVNEKSVAVPANDIETINIDKVDDIPPKAEPKTEPIINIAKNEEIEYTIASGLNKTTVVDAEYQIPYGKEPFLEKEQIVDIIKMVTVGSIAIDIIFAILHAGIIPCILLLIIAVLIHGFLVQEYHHPTYI